MTCRSCPKRINRRTNTHYFGPRHIQIMNQNTHLLGIQGRTKNGLLFPPHTMRSGGLGDNAFATTSFAKSAEGIEPTPWEKFTRLTIMLANDLYKEFSGKDTLALVATFDVTAPAATSMTLMFSFSMLHSIARASLIKRSAPFVPA
jgi:hypothetical protein